MVASTSTVWPSPAAAAAPGQGEYPIGSCSSFRVGTPHSGIWIPSGAVLPRMHRKRYPVASLPVASRAANFPFNFFWEDGSRPGSPSLLKMWMPEHGWVLGVSILRHKRKSRPSSDPPPQPAFHGIPVKSQAGSCSQ